MKTHFDKVKFSIILVVFVLIVISSLAGACTISINPPPKISSLKADNMFVYPMGHSELQCVASDPDGDALTFRWSCTDGAFTGSGPVVTWTAPNAYGNFHIMVIVEDNKGNSTKDTLTIGVVVNENQKQGCSTCPR